MKVDRPALAGAIDHLVVAAPDLEPAVAQLEGAFGARVSPGGQHPMWGTRNALLSIGAATYVEIVAPDPDRSEPAIPSLFGIDHLDRPRLVTWAVRDESLGDRVQAAASAGIGLGQILDGSRRRPDGSTLAWRLTDPANMLCDGLIPFFISWANTAHPAAGLPRAGQLISLRAVHPQPDLVRPVLDALGLDLRVDPGAAASLIAGIRTDRGILELPQ